MILYDFIILKKFSEIALCHKKRVVYPVNIVNDVGYDRIMT